MLALGVMLALLGAQGRRVGPEECAWTAAGVREQLDVTGMLESVEGRLMTDACWHLVRDAVMMDPSMTTLSIGNVEMTQVPCELGPMYPVRHLCIYSSALHLDSTFSSVFPEVKHLVVTDRLKDPLRHLTINLDRLDLVRCSVELDSSTAAALDTITELRLINTLLSFPEPIQTPIEYLSKLYVEMKGVLSLENSFIVLFSNARDVSLVADSFHVEATAEFHRYGLHLSITAREGSGVVDVVSRAPKCSSLSLSGAPIELESLSKNVFVQMLQVTDTKLLLLDDTVLRRFPSCKSIKIDRVADVRFNSPYSRSLSTLSISSSHVSLVDSSIMDLLGPRGHVILCKAQLGPMYMAVETAAVWNQKRSIEIAGSNPFRESLEAATFLSYFDRISLVGPVLDLDDLQGHRLLCTKLQMKNMRHVEMNSLWMRLFIHMNHLDLENVNTVELNAVLFKIETLTVANVGRFDGMYALESSMYNVKSLTIRGPSFPFTTARHGAFLTLSSLQLDTMGEEVPLWRISGWFTRHMTSFSITNSAVRRIVYGTSPFQHMHQLDFQGSTFEAGAELQPLLTSANRILFGGSLDSPLARFDVNGNTLVFHAGAKTHFRYINTLVFHPAFIISHTVDVRLVTNVQSPSLCFTDQLRDVHTLKTRLEHLTHCTMPTSIRAITLTSGREAVLTGTVASVFGAATQVSIRGPIAIGEGVVQRAVTVLAFDSTSSENVCKAFPNTVVLRTTPSVLSALQPRLDCMLLRLNELRITNPRNEPYLSSQFGVSFPQLSAVSSDVEIRRSAATENDASNNVQSYEMHFVSNSISPVNHPCLLFPRVKELALRSEMLRAMSAALSLDRCLFTRKLRLLNRRHERVQIPFSVLNRVFPRLGALESHTPITFTLEAVPDLTRFLLITSIDTVLSVRESHRRNAVVVVPGVGTRVSHR